MAKFTLKVSIDDSKYVIRGIDKESSRKEILCTLAKYKKKEQLPELRSALSKLNGSISKIEVKASSKFENISTRGQASTKIGSRRKGRCKNIANKACLDDRSIDASFSNEEIKTASFMKRPKNLRKVRPTSEKVVCNTKYRKKPGRSHSLNENDRRQKKYRLRERPKSFGAFDAAKILELDHSTLLELNQLIDIHGLQKMKKDSFEESFEGGGEVNSDSSKIARSRKHCAIASTNVNIRSKQKKLKDWLENLAANSIQYFIEEDKVQGSSSDPDNCLSSTERGEERKENKYYPYQFTSDKKQHYIDNTEYAEAETDSGLPSLDYESSLDTLSRDDRISIEQSCDEGRSKDAQIDSVFDCSCRNESKSGANASCDKGSIEECIRKENAELQNITVGIKISATESHLSERSGVERTKNSRNQATESVPRKSEVIEKTEDDLFTAVKCTIEKISKADENILHCELLISQLEFQLDILSENIDTIEDIEIELEEMKLVTELKDTEEFLKTITKLSQYQREAESEIIAEILSVDAKLKERQIKLQSLERKLIRQKFKSVPRHLIVSREKRLYAHHMTSDEGFSSDSEILLFDNESNSISLV